MPPEQDGNPDLDALVAELRVKVEDRRRRGEYPPGLEEALAAQFRRLLGRRVDPPREVDVRGPLDRIEQTLPLGPERIPAASRLPAGQAVHQALAKLVGRQTQGILEQVQAFADPVHQTLAALAGALDDLSREVREDLAVQVAAVVERQAAQERTGEPAAAGGAAPPIAEDGTTR
jgi:hypothetical protein